MPKQAKSKLHKLSPRLDTELVDSKIISISTDKVLYIKHSVNIGDLYAAMASIKRCSELLKRKIIVCQTINQLAAYYQGAEHPTKNEEGAMVCMNQRMFDMVAPLILSQDYIAGFEPYKGQLINLDFDVIRGKTFVNMPNGAIQQWIPLAFPDLQFDLSKSWITLKGKCPKHILQQVKGKVVLNFTERYRNGHIQYFFLQHYKDSLVFSGTKREHEKFCKEWELDIPILEANDFLEVAYALKYAKFMAGNQSMAWNLAESMKTPRMLEICQFAPNCQIMVGEKSLGYLHQVGAEWAFQELFGKTN